MIKFTVITICYNAEHVISKTMHSVLRQNYLNMEYLIIDGKSDDKTVDIAEEIKQKYPDRDIQIYSEKDFGIYNAMNRGIVRASGDYVIFMNAGDMFYNPDVLRRASRIIEKKGYGIYYGLAYQVRNDKVVGVFDFGKDKRPVLVKLMNAQAPNHQATLAPLSCMKKYYFDESYKYCADVDWLIRCYKGGIRLINMGYPVSRFDMTGVSYRSGVVVNGKNDVYRMIKKQFPIMGQLMVLLMEMR